MQKENDLYARRFGAFMYGLLDFAKENPRLLGAERIEFMPQLQRAMRQAQGMWDIRRAVADGVPREAAETFHLIEIAWDAGARTLTFSAAAGGAWAVTPRTLNLSDEILLREKAAEEPVAA